MLTCTKQRRWTVSSAVLMSQTKYINKKEGQNCLDEVSSHVCIAVLKVLMAAVCCQRGDEMNRTNEDNGTPSRTVCP